MAKLKVYRTPIGFHDAYIAAPSQKAALAGWGSTHDLFARGVAEIVTDPTLTAEPLAAPGTIIKRSRGTAEQQIAALPTSGSKTSRRSPPAPSAETRRGKAKPRPSRASLDEFETRLDELCQEHSAQVAAIDREQADLDRRRAALKKAQVDGEAKLQGALDRAEGKYAAALGRWRSDA